MNKIFLVVPLVLILTNLVIVETIKLLVLYPKEEKKFLILKIRGLIWVVEEDLIKKFLDNLEKFLNEELFDILKETLEKNKENFKEKLKEKIEEKVDKFLNQPLKKVVANLITEEIVELLSNYSYNQAIKKIEELKNSKMGSLLRKNIENKINKVVSSTEMKEKIEKIVKKTFKVIEIYTLTLTIVEIIIIEIILAILF